MRIVGERVKKRRGMYCKVETFLGSQLINLASTADVHIHI